MTPRPAAAWVSREPHRRRADLNECPLQWLSQKYNIGRRSRVRGAQKG
jgi:hypothetical protein